MNLNHTAVKESMNTRMVIKNITMVRNKTISTQSVLKEIRANTFINEERDVRIFRLKINYIKSKSNY